jgi:hypothetical protein
MRAKEIFPLVTPERLRIVADARDKCSRFAAATSGAESAGKSEVHAVHGWRHPSGKATSEPVEENDLVLIV